MCFVKLPGGRACDAALLPPTFVDPLGEESIPMMIVLRTEGTWTLLDGVDFSAEGPIGPCPPGHERVCLPLDCVTNVVFFRRLGDAEPQPRNELATWAFRSQFPEGFRGAVAIIGVGARPTPWSVPADPDPLPPSVGVHVENTWVVLNVLLKDLKDLDYSDPLAFDRLRTRFAKLLRGGSADFREVVRADTRWSDGRLNTDQLSPSAIKLGIARGQLVVIYEGPLCASTGKPTSGHVWPDRDWDGPTELYHTARRTFVLGVDPGHSFCTPPALTCDRKGRPAFVSDSRLLEYLFDQGMCGVPEYEVVDGVRKLTVASGAWNPDIHSKCPCLCDPDFLTRLRDGRWAVFVVLCLGYRNGWTTVDGQQKVIYYALHEPHTNYAAWRANPGSTRPVWDRLRERERDLKREREPEPEPEEGRPKRNCGPPARYGV